MTASGNPSHALPKWQYADRRRQSEPTYRPKSVTLLPLRSKRNGMA